MPKARTVQEYIELYKSGYSLTKITVGEEIKEELILCVEENKAKSNNILNIYASWLLEGQYIDKNVDQAVSIFQTLADQGDATAQCNLGDCYYYGEGVEQSYEQAVYWYQKAVDLGDTRAQFRLGVCYFIGQGVSQDYDQAANWFKESAEQGYLESQNILSYCYSVGRIGVKDDWDQAVYWLTKSAEQGYAESQNILGFYYGGNAGVHHQEEYWREKLASQGDAIAQCKLAVKSYVFINLRVKDRFQQAVYWYQKAADQGHADAQFNLGHCYEKGQGVEQSYERAVYWYQKAAEEGYAPAQIKLGDCYEKGQGVEQSYEQAVHWYQNAAEQEYEDAYSHLSLLYENPTTTFKDLVKSMFYQELAKGLSIVDAYTNLGNRYYNGQGVEQSYEQAVYWYQKAVDQGHARAQCNLGYCYEKGQGVEQSYEQALYWYQKSAEQKYLRAYSHLSSLYENPTTTFKDLVKSMFYQELAKGLSIVDAYNNLGNRYYNGQGVEQSYEQAVYWYQKAVEQGYAIGQCNLGRCYEQGCGVEQDYEQAVYWYQKSADQGNAIGQHYLAYCYYCGEGVEQDYKQAVHWYQKSADQGNAIGENSLAYCYYYGEGVEQDYKQAVYWYQKSAEQGYAPAQNSLGICYDKGQGVEQDYKQAVYWYQKSADQGNSKAQYNLGYCYRGGQGVPQDYEQALYWFTKSAEQKNLRAYSQLSSLYAIPTTPFKNLAKSMFYENLANGASIAVANYNVGYRYYIDENISHNKYYRYKIALEYVSKAVESGLEYAKEFKEKLEELFQKALLTTNVVPTDYKELRIGKSKDVFISWNHHDLELKNQYYNQITAHGFSCWNSDIDCHGDVRKACIEGVLDSSLFVVIISGNTLESDYVALEIQTMLKRLSALSQDDWKNYIKIIYIDRKTKKNGKIVKFNVRKEIEVISKKDPNNPFVKLLRSDIGTSEDINGIIDFIKEQVKKLKIKEYKEKYLLDMSEFEVALQNTILSNQISSGAFSTTFKYEDAYIEQPLYYGDLRIDYKDILNSKQPILIYGEGGIGKSLYLKNLSRISFTSNSFFFFNPTKEIELDNDENFYEVLYRNFESRMKRNIQVDCIQNLLEHDSHNLIYIIVDALDEINNDEKINLLKMIYEFSKRYKDIHYIFSSRNSEDGNLISSILKTETLTYTLKGMTSEDVNRLYDQILLKANNNQNKKKFLSALNKIDISIRQNPMVISNLIIIYLMSGKLPSRIYEIIQTMANIVFENQEKDSDASFKYKDFFNAEELRKILEFMAYMRSKNVKLPSVELLNIFYSKYSFFKEELKEDKLIALSVNEYLKRRCILIQGNISHQIYSDYFASSYCYSHAYQQDNNEQSVFLMPIKNGIKMQKLLKNIESYGEQWFRIILYFVLHVDYVCDLIDKENPKNEIILKNIFELCLNQIKMKKLLIQYLKNKQFYHTELLQIEIDKKSE